MDNGITLITDKKLSNNSRAAARQVAIEFDEDQQAEFVERVDVLNLRIRRFLVQFAIVSFVEIIQVPFLIQEPNLEFVMANLPQLS